MTSLKIDIKGVGETIAELEKRFGKMNMDRAVDTALTAGAGVIKSEIEKNFEGFKDTGASKDEITVSKPMTLQGKRTVVIYWSGPKNRYTIIHLNEYGTIKNPNPAGKGAIESAMRAGRAEYFRVLKREIAGAIR